MKKHKVLIIVGAVVIVLAAAGLTGYSILQNNVETLRNTEIEDVDLNLVPDGVFTGSYSRFPGSAEVSVTVHDHIITDIKLVKLVSGRGQTAEAIPGMVVEAQSLNVDAVSGATSSSKIILLAIEDALKKYGN